MNLLAPVVAQTAAASGWQAASLGGALLNTAAFSLAGIALAAIPEIAGNRPVCGVWVVNHEACGLGIREDTRRITGNLSRFVPHRMG